MPVISSHRRLAAPLLAFAVSAALLPAPLFAQSTAPAPATSRVPEKRPAGPVSLEGLPILRVEVIGNTRTETRLILDQVRSQPGQPYALSLVDVDQRAIAALDRFVTVSAKVRLENDANGNPKGVVVQFVVEERPNVASVEIVGNRAFSDTQLRDAMTIHAGGALDPFFEQTDIKTILDMYRKKGYAEANVTIDQNLLQKGIVRYTIQEGPRSKINKIEFVGNDHIKGSYLRFKISTKTSFWFFRKGVLDEDKLSQDLITVRDAYLKRGYIDARVSYSLDYSEDKSKLTVRFAVIEGPRYKIGKINVSGNKVFGTAELLGDLSKFGPGSFAERDKIDALQKRIEDHYGHEGYIDSNVITNPVYTDVPGVVDLDIKIVEGNPYLVGRVIVRGNPYIQDRVIRRQIRIYPDQTYDKVLVNKSIERLKAIRIFSDVKITPIDSPGNPADVKDALVEVGEGQTGKFLIGAGVSTNSGLVGQISLEQQNFDIGNPPHSLGEFLSGQSFKGAGQYFRILLEPGTEFQRYRVTFEEPFLFDSPYSFSNDIYYFTRGRESWDERRIGDIVTLGRRFGDVYSASLAFRAEQVTITNAIDRLQKNFSDVNYPIYDGLGNQIGTASDSAQQILDQDGSHFITSIKPGIVRDTTDSRIFPTTGTRSVLAWEQYGAMGGDATFSKLTLRFDWYTPLWEDIFERKTVFALRNQLGFDFLGDSPFYERFYGGGIGDLRGFKYRGVGPVAGELNDPVGADFSWVTTAEVNFPIYENLLRGVVFTDVGDYESDIKIGTVRSDVGAGVRITIPFFGQLPLALDFAIPVTKANHDKTQIVSFSLGIPF
ncbi:MAG TPA: outer membrane protein assembly factor BamA [Phycisphaerae bacterium]|nr:outer membrane protein assembly factor BamA [Phycisphaerae bacterium]